MRDVSNGYIVRYVHANVASFFFIFVYALYFFFIFNFFFLFNYFILYIKGFIAEFEIKFKNYYLDNSISNSILDLEEVSNSILDLEEEFLQWFVGFCDAESSFIISIKNNSGVYFKFQIRLHIEDSSCLYFIKNKLGVGVINLTENNCTYTVNSYSDIANVILPIFSKYPLLTIKRLDFENWKSSILLIAGNKHSKLEPLIFNEILTLKATMNRGRKEINNYSIDYTLITKYWLLGFTEGDGSFYFSNFNANFSLTQKDLSILKAISIYLTNLPLNPPYKGLFKPSIPVISISNLKNENAYKLNIQNRDVLFQYIYPLFKDLKFLTRKRIDFLFWSLGLHILILGYINITLGKSLFLKITTNMNNNRYFKDIDNIIDMKEVKNLFLIEPPFDIFSGKSYFFLSKEYQAKMGSIKGYKVYVYKNNLQLKSSPFTSYRSVSRSLGIISVSSIKNYINTGKEFKGYTFYSEPLTFI